MQYLAYLRSDETEHRDVADASAGTSTIKPSKLKVYCTTGNSQRSPDGIEFSRRPTQLSDESRFYSAVDMESGQQGTLQAAIRVYRRKIYPTRPSSPTRHRSPTQSAGIQTSNRSISDVTATPSPQGAPQPKPTKRGGNRTLVPWLLRKREKNTYIINISYPKSYIEARTRMGDPLDNHYSRPYPDVQPEDGDIMGSSVPTKKRGGWTFGWKKKPEEKQETAERENAGKSLTGGWHPWAKIQRSASKELMKKDKADAKLENEKEPAYAEPPAASDNISSSTSNDRRPLRVSHRARPSNGAQHISKGLNLLIPYMPDRHAMPRKPIPFIPQLPTTEDTEHGEATGPKTDVAKDNLETASIKSGIRFDRDSLMEALQAAEIAAEIAMRPTSLQKFSTAFGTDGAAPPGFSSNFAEINERRDDETLARRRSGAVLKRLSAGRHTANTSPVRPNRYSKLFKQNFVPTSPKTSAGSANGFRDLSPSFPSEKHTPENRSLGMKSAVSEGADAAVPIRTDPLAHRFRKCGGLAPLTSGSLPGRWGLRTRSGQRELGRSMTARPKLKDLITCVACEAGVWVFEKRFYCDECGMTVHTSCLQDLNVFAHGCQDYAAFRASGGQRLRSRPASAAFSSARFLTPHKKEQIGGAEIMASDASDILSFLAEGSGGTQRFEARQSLRGRKSFCRLTSKASRGKIKPLKVDTRERSPQTRNEDGPSRNAAEETSNGHRIPKMRPISPFPETIFTSITGSTQPSSKRRSKDSRLQESLTESRMQSSRTENAETLSRSTAAFKPPSIPSKTFVTDALTKPVHAGPPLEGHVIPLARCVSTSSFYGENEDETPSSNMLVLLPDTGENL